MAQRDVPEGSTTLPQPRGSRDRCHVCRLRAPCEHEHRTPVVLHRIAAQWIRSSHARTFVYYSCTEDRAPPRIPGHRLTAAGERENQHSARKPLAASCKATLAAHPRERSQAANTATTACPCTAARAPARTLRRATSGLRVDAHAAPTDGATVPQPPAASRKETLLPRVRASCTSGEHASLARGAHALRRRPGAHRAPTESTSQRGRRRCSSSNNRPCSCRQA